MSFGENLQRLRKGRNISQENLAEELNVSRQTVGKWENGITYPETECLIQISEFFNVSIDVLLKGTIQDTDIAEMPASGIANEDVLAQAEEQVKSAADSRQRNRKIRFIVAIIFFTISPFYPGKPGANSMHGFFMILCIAVGIGLLVYNHLTKDQAE